MTRVRGGKSIYGASVGILMLDARFPRIPGDMGHVGTWPFPVLYRVVRGATPDRVVRRGGEGTLGPFIDAARDLVRDGVDGITTNCGFLSVFQHDIAKAVGVPVATSSLMQTAMVNALLPPGKKAGILTISGSSLTPAHLIAAGIDGVLVNDAPKYKTPRILSFSSHDLPIDLPTMESFRQRGEGEAEYILPELLQMGWSDSSSEAQRNASQASFNYRMVELAMMLFLPLLAVALAIPPKRSTSALGVFVAVVLVVAYHKINQYMQDFAALGRIDPMLGLWGPFAVFVLLIVWWFWQIAYVPGGQPIGALENVFSKIVKRIGRIIRPRRRADAFRVEQSS